MARRAKDQYDLLFQKSGGTTKNMRSVPFEDDLEVFRSFGTATQRYFIVRLKHRKEMLEKDWFIPGITLVVVAATALILASTTMLPYALQWRAETQDVIRTADALGLDQPPVNPDALVDYYTTTLYLTAGTIAACAGMLVLWNFTRAWRLATTTVWIEALEADVAARNPEKTERMILQSLRSVAPRWRAKTTKNRPDEGTPS